jgi:hypothetical protein
MVNRRARPPRPADPTRLHEFDRWSRDDIVSVKGERGRFRIRYFKIGPFGPEATVYGGSKGREMTRTFLVERLRTKHRAKEL